MDRSLPGDTIVSLLGKRLSPPGVSAEAYRALQDNLAQAQENYKNNPDLVNTIWYGRRLAYLFQFSKAIDVYTDGTARFPEAHQLYRQRGHRHISIRQFEKAIADFKKAAELAEGQPVEVKPDGVPNRLNRPTSNTHFNIWYHLGLAYYLTGAYKKAAPAYRTCLQYCQNDDSLTATVDWLYMTYRRLGQKAEADKLLALIREEMDLIESPAYHNRLLMYKGLFQPEQLLNPREGTEHDTQVAIATQGYGVGNWYFYNGDKARARSMFAQVLQSKNWSAFGYIAAEVDLRHWS